MNAPPVMQSYFIYGGSFLHMQPEDVPPTAVAIIQRQVRSAANNYQYKNLLPAKVT